MLAKTIATCGWIVLLIVAAAGQQPLPRRLSLQKTPPGMVYVSQRIDVVRQLGSTENIFTLDGEPLPMMQSRNITLGVILDDKGHIVVRLAGATPENPPQDVLVYTPTSPQLPASFIGMDTVTGLCVLKVENPVFNSPAFAESAALPVKGSVRLYGFNPRQSQRPTPGLTLVKPRINDFPCSIAKAIGDFRYSPRTPIYYLSEPSLTPVQDGSVLFDGNNRVFGIAIYDISGEDKHLVYPITRVLSIAQAIIKANDSIAHGWLGASGKDMYAPIKTPLKNPEAMKGSSYEPGVRVTNIFPDGPAELAGVHQQDILLSISGRRVANLAQLGNTLRQLPADSEVTLKVKRGEEYKVLQAKLMLAPGTTPDKTLNYITDKVEAIKKEMEKLPPNDPARQKLQGKVTSLISIINGIFDVAPPEGRLRGLYGLDVELLTPQLREYFSTSGNLLVSNATDRAAKTGLLAGDVIIKVGENEVKDVASLVKALDEGVSGSEKVELVVTRQREQIKIPLAR